MRKIYATYAEQRAARNARQNAKRAQLIASGMTSKGTPRRRYVPPPQRPVGGFA